MREDPIIYEDWQPSFARREKYRSLQFFDGLLSQLFLVFPLIAGIQSQSASSIVLTVGLQVGFLVYEFIPSQYNRSSMARLIAVVFLSFLTTFIPFIPDEVNGLVVRILFGFILLVKLGLIPVLDILNDGYGEILFPRNIKVKEKLEYQLKVLSVTDYAINAQQQDNLRISFVRNQMLQFLLPGLISILLVFSSETLPGTVIKVSRIILYILIIMTSLLLQSVLFGPQLLKVIKEEGLVKFILRKIRFKKSKKKSVTPLQE